MDLDMMARVHVLELLTTQLISEYLRTVPDPAAGAAALAPPRGWNAGGDGKLG